MNHVAQSAVDGDHACLEIPDAPDELALATRSVRGKHMLQLPAEELEIGGKGGDVLDSSVMKIEAAARQQPLAGIDKGALPRGVSSEKRFPLQDERERGCGLAGSRKRDL